MTRLRILGALLLIATAGRAGPLEKAAHATTELDTARAQALLTETQATSDAAAFERARLAIYRGDCDTAEAILTAPSSSSEPEMIHLREVARGCARALAGAIVVHDEKRGVWIRLQDARDEALVPFIVQVAVASREYLSRELHIDMPRPLRIELVRDLFSLAAVTGLPVEAAETTGTVGVARFGRVILVSPRATPRGYPWEDTLAHEIVHLFVTRASRDYAPLWLQEGVAKMYESGWRAPRPFDDRDSHDRIARLALVSGKSIGLHGLGQSIALLPTPEMAKTAYAEVTSFMRYWVGQEGSPALRLLFADLRGVGTKDTDVALRSVTGYELETWDAEWKRHLETTPPAPAPHTSEALSVEDVLGVREVVRGARLADLLAQRGHYDGAAAVLAPALKGAPREASLRWRMARIQLSLDREPEAKQALGQIDEIEGPHGGWFALHARLRGDPAERAVAVALDPYAEEVACGGDFRRRTPGTSDPRPASLPDEPEWRQLCLAARKIPRD